MSPDGAGGGGGTPVTPSPHPVAGARRAASNIASLLSSNVVNRATSFVVYAIVGRYRGANELGQLALAITLLYFFNRLVVMGLQTLTTREVSRDPSSTERYLVNATAIILLTSAIGYLGAYVFVELMGYPADTSRVVLITFIGLAPLSIATISEAALLAWHKAHYIAGITTPVYVVQTAVAFWLIDSGRPIETVAVSIVAAYSAIALFQFVVAARVARVRSFRVEPAAARAMVREGTTFLGIQASLALRASLTVILISTFLTEADVGIYSAARQLIVPLGLISQAVGLGLFPTMVQRSGAGTDPLRDLVGKVTEVMTAIMLPAVVGLALLARPVLELVYGSEGFEQSETVLLILVWSALAGAWTAVLGQALWAEGRERDALRIAVVNLVVNAALLIVLIPRYGLNGAAVGVVVVGIFNVVQLYVEVARALGGFQLWAALWRPAVAVAAMAVPVLATASLHVVVRTLIGAMVYSIVIAVIVGMTAGGWKALRVPR
jgi:O-antigen/teichoic acid export membrane protein